MKLAQRIIPLRWLRIWIACIASEIVWFTCPEIETVQGRLLQRHWFTLLPVHIA